MTEVTVAGGATTSAVTVVGGGPAAHRLVGRLRHHGHRGPVTILGGEAAPAYHRALLGSVLDGTLPAAGLALPPYPPDVQVRTGVRVTAVDRDRRLVRTDDGAEHPYEVLVLATGSRPAATALPGAGAPSAPDVRAPHSLADAAPPGTDPVVVAGGGIRGTETAYALARAGHEVTLVHPGAHPLHRLLDARAGAVLTAALQGAGVTLETGRRVTAAEPGKVVLDDGRLLSAGTLLLHTGTVPDAALAARAGLTVRHGVVVDDRLRTSDPSVYALGDCAEHPGADGTLDSAWEQADALARVLTGDDRPWQPAPRLVRPRLPGLDLAIAVAGPPDSPGAVAGPPDRRDAVAGPPPDLPGAVDVPDGERITLSDPARGRYASLVVRDERIHTAVLIGLPRAIAAVGRLHAGRRPLPADRLALLLGTDEEYASSTELPDSAVVCHCNHVTKGALDRARDDGARDLAALAAATRATTGCGSCTSLVRRLCTGPGQAPQ